MITAYDWVKPARKPIRRYEASRERMRAVRVRLEIENVFVKFYKIS